jgi:regulator of sigma E protease
MSMTEGLAALFWGIVTFSLLVVVHEGGHFLAARMFGVKVHEFMVGLPGPAVRWHGPKTTYGVTAIPLGGYVRIAGMEPGPEDPLLPSVLAYVTSHGPASAPDLATALGIDERAADAALLTLADWDALVPVPGSQHTYRSRFESHEARDEDALLDTARSVTYRSLRTWQRVTLLSMGVIFNLATAILVFTVVLSAFGYMKETGRVAMVSSGSAAESAGIAAGDRITAIGGRETPDFQRLVSAISTYRAGDRADVHVERGVRRFVVTVTFGANPESGRALLGVTPELSAYRPGVIEALLLSFSYIGLTFVAIAGFFNPATFQASVSQSSSVIGAAIYAADAAKAGPLDYAGIIAVLSLSLGAINILPIPPLDGGKIAIELIERIRGRQLPRNLSLGISATGAILLFSLIGYLMYADVLRIMGG